MEEVMKERQQMARGNDVGKQEESFVCSECGSDVPASAGRCPQCGESFEEDTQGAEKGKYECSECGATVDEGARSCWNCGKEFEE
jgi:predicted amidophosphoribosyltransferase